MKAQKTMLSGKWIGSRGTLAIRILSAVGTSLKSLETVVMEKCVRRQTGLKPRLAWRICFLPRLFLVGLVLSAMVALIPSRPAAVGAVTCTTNPVVTNNGDSGAGSLRQAIMDACDGSTITFAGSVTSPITLTTGEVAIDKNLTITGPGASALTISGNNFSPVFLITSAAIFNVTLSGLTIANGKPFTDLGAGGIFDEAINGTLTIMNSTISGNTGGGIFNLSSMTITNSTISGNTGTPFGAGIQNEGTLAITNSTISGNKAIESSGGIFNDVEAVMTITNSTISGNTGPGLGGGIDNLGNMAITNSTISGNKAGVGGGGGIFNDGFMTITNNTISGNTADVNGGGIENTGTVNVKNTIIAGNSAAVGGPDGSGGSFVSGGHNLIGDGTLTNFTNGVNGDQVGSTASPIDPKLGPLQNNGGPTFTMALLAGSPAIDAGDDSVVGSPLFLTTDQRGAGFLRKFGSHVDIGAFEFQQVNTCLKDNSTGNLFQWNSTTGQYKFTRCSDGFMLSGTGVAKVVNGVSTLTDFKSDRRISAGFNTGQLTGSATIYLMVAQGVWQSFRIVDTNPSAVCACVVPT